MEFLHHPAFWIVLTAASELIGMSKLKDNSIVQLVLHSLFTLKGKKEMKTVTRPGYGGKPAKNINCPAPKFPVRPITTTMGKIPGGK